MVHRGLNSRRKYDEGPIDGFRESLMLLAEGGTNSGPSVFVRDRKWPAVATTFSAAV